MAEESVSDLPWSRRFLKSLFGDNDAVRKIEFFYFIIVYLCIIIFILMDSNCLMQCLIFQVIQVLGYVAVY